MCESREEICEKDFIKRCNQLREMIGNIGSETRDLMTNPDFQDDSLEKFPGMHGEMKANIMLAFRHLEDARMRIGKTLQALGGGKSIYDKNQ